MKQCASCGSMVSDQASYCHICGLPLNPSGSTRVVRMTMPKKEKGLTSSDFALLFLASLVAVTVDRLLPQTADWVLAAILLFTFGIWMVLIYLGK